MVVLDGRYYHFHADGTVSEAEDSEKVPFAAVTHFVPDFRFTISAASMADIGTTIDQMLPSPNWFYAVKIHGPFSSVSTRAIPKQSVPYPPLSTAVLQQVVFHHSDVAGTAVVLRCPAYEKGINQVGYHYHFVSDDTQIGGHALDFTTGTVVVEVQILRQNSVWLPENSSFLKATLPLSD
jgi:acetolactate decarboxylase